MTTKQLAQRLQRIEAARRPAARLLVCGCALVNGRENLPEHLPGCPALAAGDGDNVVTVRYEDRARVGEPIAAEQLFSRS